MDDSHSSAAGGQGSPVDHTPLDKEMLSLESGSEHDQEGLPPRSSDPSQPRSANLDQLASRASGPSGVGDFTAYAQRWTAVRKPAARDSSKSSELNRQLALGRQGTTAREPHVASVSRTGQVPKILHRATMRSRRDSLSSVKAAVSGEIRALEKRMTFKSALSSRRTSTLHAEGRSSEKSRLAESASGERTDRGKDGEVQA